MTEKVLQLPEYQNAKSISIFLSMPKREISTTALVEDALHRGKKVFIPYIHAAESGSNSKVMDMLRISDEQDLHSLQPDNWGIPSLPDESIDRRENALGGSGILQSASLTKVELDLIFMPGMAFDSSNNRLGHGRGFYDKYLSRVESVLKQQSSSSARAFPALGESFSALHFIQVQMLTRDKSVLLSASKFFSLVNPCRWITVIGKLIKL